jgi:hypothetical protein
MIYLASSWKTTDRLDLLAATLKYNGYEFYDFRADDERSKGFHWSDLGPHIRPGAGSVAETPASDFAAMLQHPMAVAAHKRDMDHLHRADCLILVLPSGKSAHAEYGMAVASGKHTIVWVEELVQPELLYASADSIAWNITGVLDSLQRKAMMS